MEVQNHITITCPLGPLGRNGLTMSSFCLKHTIGTREPAYCTRVQLIDAQCPEILHTLTVVDPARIDWVHGATSSAEYEDDRGGFRNIRVYFKP